MKTCPHCGKPVDGNDELLIHEVAGVARRGDRVARLGITELRVLHALHKSRPMPVAASTLQNVITSHQPARIAIFKLRGKLPKIGLGIETVGQAGYRLVEKPA